MTKIQPDQIKVGAGPEHSLPKYGAAPGFELEASRISDNGTNIDAPTLVFNTGDFELENNGTRIQLRDATKFIQLYANRSDVEQASLLTLSGSPGLAILSARAGELALAELRLEPATPEIKLGFSILTGTLRLTAEISHLVSNVVNIGLDPDSEITLNGKLTLNGIRGGIASSVEQLAQTASISPTDILIDDAVISAGLYRLSYYLVITTPGTSGTVKATFAWGDIAAARSVDSDTVTFGTLAAPVSGTLIVQADGLTDLTYATTVADAVGDPQYALFITLEQLQ